MSDFESLHPRHSAGTSGAGQFATKVHGESSVSLEALDAPGGADAFVDHIWRAAAMIQSSGAHGASTHARALLALQERALAQTPDVDPDVARDDFCVPMLTAALEGRDEQVAQLAARLADLDAAERAWRADPTFTPPQPWDGLEVDAATGAQHTRADIVTAQRAGYLPAGARFEVRPYQSPAGGIIDVVVRDMPAHDVYQAQAPATFRRRYSAYAAQVRERVRRIGQVYCVPREQAAAGGHVTRTCFVEIQDGPERAGTSI